MLTDTNLKNSYICYYDLGYRDIFIFEILCWLFSKGTITAITILGFTGAADWVTYFIHL